MSRTLTLTLQRRNVPPIIPLTLGKTTLIHRVRTLVRRHFLRIILVFSRMRRFLMRIPSLLRHRNFCRFLISYLGAPCLGIILTLQRSCLRCLLRLRHKFSLSVVGRSVLDHSCHCCLNGFQQRSTRTLVRQLTRRTGLNLSPTLISRLITSLAITSRIHPVRLRIIKTRLRRRSVAALITCRHLNTRPGRALIRQFLSETMGSYNLRGIPLTRNILCLLASVSHRRHPCHPPHDHSSLTMRLALHNDLCARDRLSLILRILIKSKLIFVVPSPPLRHCRLIRSCLISCIQQRSLPTRLN